MVGEAQVIRSLAYREAGLSETEGQGQEGPAVRGSGQLGKLRGAPRAMEGEAWGAAPSAPWRTQEVRASSRGESCLGGSRGWLLAPMIPATEPGLGLAWGAGNTDSDFLNHCNFFIEVRLTCIRVGGNIMIWCQLILMGDQHGKSR